MKKLFIMSLCFISSIGNIHAYEPSTSLQENLEVGAGKISILIENKGEDYREIFLGIIDKYKLTYIGDERNTYILNYIYNYIDEREVSPNILLIIADDMGLDAMPGFSQGEIKPYTPHIQSFMEKGVTFENLWSAPICTPTRSTILTGKYGYHTNVLEVDDELSTNETSLQSYLDQTTNNSYSHAVIGKWHLSKDASHPTNMGVGYYAGLLTGGAKSYNNWKLTENGSSKTSNEYITTKFTDLAINWVEKQETPWFLWLAYTAPHTPFHLPPSELHSQENLSDDAANIEENPLPYYMAAIEAMDTEIGRLLDSIPQEELANTTIIFLGDNGTPGKVAQEPYGRRTVKGSLYQGGINVPLVVSGYGVTREGQREDTLLNTTDIFATITDIANTDIDQIHDSISFKNTLTEANTTGRTYSYGEVSSGNTAGYTIRNGQYKLMILDNGNDFFFDIKNDPYETKNLLKNNLTTEQLTQREILENYISKVRTD